MVHGACARSTAARGGGGAYGVGVFGSLTLNDTRAVTRRLLDVAPPPKGMVPALLDLGVGDGRVLMAAPALPRLYGRPCNLFGIDFTASTMRLGLDLHDPNRRQDNFHYREGVMAHFGGRDPLAAYRPRISLGVVMAEESYAAGAAQVDHAPRVRSLHGATHLLIVWAGWNHPDRAEAFRLARQTPSLVAICVVDFDKNGPDSEWWEDWAVKSGEYRTVRMAGGGTVLYAHFLRRRADASQAPDPLREESALRVLPQLQPLPPAVQTRSMHRVSE